MKDIKLLACDVDGTLTDGFYHVSEEGVTTKSFYTRDIWAIDEFLRITGCPVEIITQAKDSCVIQKFNSLLLRHTQLYVNIGISDKYDSLYHKRKSRNLEWSEVAYIGDAENDLECIRAVGFSASPSDAVPIIKHNVNAVSNYAGGRGAVHEIIMMIIGEIQRNGKKITNGT